MYPNAFITPPYPKSFPLFYWGKIKRIMEISITSPCKRPIEMEKGATSLKNCFSPLLPLDKGGELFL
jgi:hypothetical protein